MGQGIFREKFTGKFPAPDSNMGAINVKVIDNY